MEKLTIHDILKGQQERSNGYGLFYHDVRTPAFWITEQNPYAALENFDQTIIKLANKRKWTFDTLCEFMDSKIGRWCSDSLTDRKDIEATISKHMDQFSK